MEANDITFWIMYLGMWMIFSAIFILYIVAMWKIFKKAGKPGWASIVPYYQTYVLAQVAYGDKLGYMGIIAMVASFVPIIGGLVNGFLIIHMAICVFKNFGCSVGNSILLTIFNAIGILWLGFGKTPYLGVQDNMITRKFS